MASGSWSGLTSSAWNVNGNWTGASYPSVAGETATLNLPAGGSISLAGTTIDLGAAGSLVTSGGGTWNITRTGSETFYVGTANISTPTTITVPLGTTGQFIKSGTGTLTLAAGATNTGSWTVSAGTLAITAGTSTATRPVGLTNNAVMTTAVSTSGSTYSLYNTSSLTLGGSAAAVYLYDSSTATITAGTTSFAAGYGSSTLNVNGGILAGTIHIVSGTLNINSPGKVSTASTFFVRGDGGGVVIANIAGDTISTGHTWFGGSADSKVAIYHTAGTVTGGNAVSQWMFIGTSPNASPMTAATYTYYRGTGGFLDNGQSNNPGILINTGTNLTPGSRTVVEFRGTTLKDVTVPFYFGNSTYGSTLSILSALAANGITYGSSAKLTTGFQNNVNIDAVDGAASLTSSTGIGIGGVSGIQYLNVKDDGVLTVGYLSGAGLNTRQVNLWGGKISTSGATGYISSADTAMPLRLYSRAGKTNRLSASTGAGSINVPVTEYSTGNCVSVIDITAAGSGYIGAPHVEITGGGGSGAAARAVVDITPGSPTQGQVTSIVVTSPGGGYTSTPTVTLYGGRGNTGADASATATTTPVTTGVGFTKQDSGTLTLNAANTYTGTTTVEMGTLQVGGGSTAGTLGDSNAGAASIAASATLALNRSDAVSYSSTITGPLTSNLNRTGSTTGTAATLTGNISGFLGFVSIAANNTLAITGPITLTDSTSGITVANTGALTFDANVTSNRPLSLAGSGFSSGGCLVSSGTTNLSGAVTLTGTSTISSTSGTLTLSGVVSGSNLGITKVGADALALNSPSSTFTGAVTISAGTVSVRRLANSGSNSSLGTGAGTAAIVVANGATLKHTGGYTSATNRPLSATSTTAGTVTLDASGTSPMVFTGTPTGAAGALAKTLALTGTGTSNNGISFSLTDTSLTASSTVALVKTGSGTWVLSGTGNTYSGGTTIAGTGKLVANSSNGAARFGSGNVSVGAGSYVQTLTGTAQQGQHTYSANLTFATGGKIRLGGIVGSGAIYMAGALTLPAAPNTTTWDLRNDQRYNSGGQFTLFEFAPGVAAPTNVADLPNNVNLLTWDGHAATSGPTYVAEDTTLGTPARIVVTLA